MLTRWLFHWVFLCLLFLVGCGGSAGQEGNQDSTEGTTQNASETGDGDGDPGDGDGDGDPGDGDGDGDGDEAPVIVSFSAMPQVLPMGGGTVTLGWDVINADELSINQGVGVVMGDTVMVDVSSTTVYTLTATNDYGSTMAITAVSVGQNPSESGGRGVHMVSPVSGESFTAPSSLRLIASGHDPNVPTNEPTPGHGGNASLVQFFVDDDIVLEVDGQDAEYWIFKGFTADVAAGQHVVWARAIYVNPDLVLDSLPVIIDVNDPPTYGQTIDLDADVVLSGAMGYELSGTANARIRLNGNGYSITSSDGASGPLTLEFVDVFNLGDPNDTSSAGIDVATSGSITIADSNFDGSNPVRTNGASSTITRNVFRSNMRMPIGQFPDPNFQDGPTYPVAELGGSGNKTFTGNNVGASYVAFSGGDWTIGGDTAEDSNVFIGARVGVSIQGDATIRGNYSHHIYYGGWSQGANFELGGDSDVVTEHNVITGSSWPIRGIAGEFRYNLVLDAGHQWLWAGDSGCSIHHNVFIGGEADVGGIYILYDPQGVEIYNNTIDGLGEIGRAIQMENGVVSLTSNLLYRVPSPGVNIVGGTLTADYNAFFEPMESYSDGTTPANDISGMDPNLTDPPQDEPFDLDEVGVWKRMVSVPFILDHYRMRYTPQPGSPVIDAGDPAGGAGNDIGAVGAGQANTADQFGML